MKKRIVYFYDDDIGNFMYNQGHPMKPHRIRMAHNLIMAYELFSSMRVLRPRRATALDMTRFHTDEYVQFLQVATPKNTSGDDPVLEKFNIDGDSPVFNGVFEFCQISAGGSISGAQELISGKCDIAINWAGGLHHAKKAEASGFCYCADCVLGILKLLDRYDRVMYIDIDIHHGDGVEEAFYTTDRVLTVSFHKYGDDFFPCTGNKNDIGIDRGKGYAVNVPLSDGLDDAAFESIFKPVMSRLIEWYRPGAILLQCGADSLTGDRIGCFNLTLKGHAMAVEFIKNLKIPLLVTGGGGYTVRNVARCWAYETAVLTETPISDELPYNEYMGYFGPDYRLHLQPSNMENTNSEQDLNDLMQLIDNHMKDAQAAPSVDWALGVGTQKKIDALGNVVN
ncbi:acetylpolyamine aminohydrolase, putative [Trichomonas vaginalis G3]|uniref:Histone deacetylase n=1 Tax=Trichomonas vaginalis (strain ATCC PRA-98 / G3) TaxID=412133 RepID=A2DYU2_TRIV3|nr:histone deacetylase class I, eukaryotic type family [Trichomonas vaginalis G3]EAY14482.1 acetylpolyamine aminohydrolase, putative [Trichomonas vaginalis G3]KAI5519674.1 histone deacetylase class I, eukaryotic type family [Trichomonas vaginalis G3]|eukprot:XP_001326705.1 acetylpolyamine aminohydrolase [Trichomonas vaginalis G3]